MSHLSPIYHYDFSANFRYYMLPDSDTIPLSNCSVLQRTNSLDFTAALFKLIEPYL
jgi:hypothetical protein